MNYVYLNNNISAIVNKDQVKILDIEREIFEMEIKHEIIVPPVQDFITEWLEKSLVLVIETN